jgi:hypothetical protein
MGSLGTPCYMPQFEVNNEYVFFNVMKMKKIFSFWDNFQKIIRRDHAQISFQNAKIEVCDLSYKYAQTV